MTRRNNSQLPLSLHKATVSAAYPLFILNIAEELGLDAAELLAGSGLSYENLQTSNLRISVLQHGKIIDNLMKMTQYKAIGIDLGMRSSLTKIGMIGFGLMSCATFRAAIELGLRYLPIRIPYFSMSFSVDGDVAMIDIHEALPLGRHRIMAFEYLMIELSNIYLLLMNPATVREYSLASEMWFMHNEPEYFDQYRDRLPLCRFGMPVYRMRFDARQLDLPLQTANQEAAKQVTEYCERELALLGVVDVPARVRAMLVCDEHGYPSIEAVAEQLHMSSRTLKRKLQEHNLSFSGLLEEVRKREAMSLLAMPNMTVTEVATRVGYTNRVNFTRAFRQWTGESPSEYLARTRHIGLD